MIDFGSLTLIWHSVHTLNEKTNVKWMWTGDELQEDSAKCIDCLVLEFAINVNPGSMEDLGSTNTKCIILFWNLLLM